VEHLDSERTPDSPMSGEEWLAESARLVNTLLGDGGRDSAMSTVLEWLRGLTSADVVGISMLDSLDPEHALIAQILGPGMKRALKTRVEQRGMTARVLQSGQRIVSSDVVHEHDFAPPDEFRELLSSVRTLFMFPLRCGDTTIGMFCTGWLRGSLSEKQISQELSLIEALGEHVALALRHIEAEEAHRRRESYLQASTELSRLGLADIDRDQVMREVIQRLRKITDCDYSAIILSDVAEPTSAITAFQAGSDEIFFSSRVGRFGLVSRVLETAETIVTDDLPHEQGYDKPEEWRRLLDDAGFGVLTPLVAYNQVIGVLCAVWRRGSWRAVEARGEVELIETFASQAAVVLHQVQVQEERSWRRVLEDRDRIAGDLHDRVLRRILAVVMRLESAAALSTEPEVRARVEESIAELDDTTQQVRSSIFELHHASTEPGSVRADLLREIDAARDILGFTPRLVLRGPIEEALPSEVRSALAPALRHAFENAAAHASTTFAEVTIVITDDELTLSVTDNGTDVGGPTQRAATWELESSARQLGGRCSSQTLPDGRCALEWRVPLRS
jgi:signal transduction histidine kinase